VSEALDRRVAARRQADLVAGLRRISQTAPVTANGGAAEADEHCDVCGKGIPAEHRHLLHLTERYILCACESCVAIRGGDGDYRPTGTRTVWLEDFTFPDELWATFAIPIGLAFFLISSSVGSVVAMYPSPAGATESELELGAWQELVEHNPELVLEPDAEALVVNRTADPHQHAIAPIDECYRLVGLVKTSWEGISGGQGPEEAIASFFGELQAKAVAA
jgi:hypothetical protein